MVRRGLARRKLARREGLGKGWGVGWFGASEDVLAQRPLKLQAVAHRERLHVHREQPAVGEAGLQREVGLE